MVAAANIRQIRRKIRSVENLRKITRAMQMVAAAKLRRTQTRLQEIRAYADRIHELVARLSAREGARTDPLLQARPEIRRIGLVAIAADRGLCGTYNAAVTADLNRFLQEIRVPVTVVAIGRRAAEFFERRGIPVRARYSGLSADVPFSLLEEISGMLVGAFRSGEVDEVWIGFSEFVNVLVQRPKRIRFLPVEPPEAAGKPPEYEFEPAPGEILSRLLPRFLETTLYRILLEALSSEHAARMNAMRNATDNATEMIDHLTLVRNKVRQAMITRELLDIVGGAEVLRS